LPRSIPNYNIASCNKASGNLDERPTFQLKVISREPLDCLLFVQYAKKIIIVAFMALINRLTNIFIHMSVDRRTKYLSQ
jgi:hypothetical protein